MKKFNILYLQLITALIALAGSAVNLVGVFIDIPSWLSILSAACLLLSAAVWLWLYLVNTKKK